MKLKFSFQKLFPILLVCVFVNQNAIASRCYGSDNCKACRSCSSCKLCNDEGGSCGVCSGGSNSENANNKSSSGFGKFALIGGGTYLLYSLLNKKKNK